MVQEWFCLLHFLFLEKYQWQQLQKTKLECHFLNKRTEKEDNYSKFFANVIILNKYFFFYQCENKRFFVGLFVIYAKRGQNFIKQVWTIQNFLKNISKTFFEIYTIYCWVGRKLTQLKFANYLRMSLLIFFFNYGFS